MGKKDLVELKPCAHCGSDVAVRESEGGDPYISCDCGVQMFSDMKWDGGEESRLIKAWNTRIEPSIEAKYVGVVNVLKQLVLLKNTKDKHGKTEAYLELMPITWDKARKALKELD